MDDRRYQNNRVHHHVLSAWKTTKESTIGRFIAYLLLGGEKWEFAINSWFQFHFPRERYASHRWLTALRVLMNFTPSDVMPMRCGAREGNAASAAAKVLSAVLVFVCVCESVDIGHTDWIRSHAAIFIWIFPIRNPDYSLHAAGCLPGAALNNLAARCKMYILRLYYTF